MTILHNPLNKRNSPMMLAQTWSSFHTLLPCIMHHAQFIEPLDSHCTGERNKCLIGKCRNMDLWRSKKYTQHFLTWFLSRSIDELCSFQFKFILVVFFVASFHYSRCHCHWNRKCRSLWRTLITIWNTNVILCQWVKSF